MRFWGRAIVIPFWPSWSQRRSALDRDGQRQNSAPGHHLSCLSCYGQLWSAWQVCVALTVKNTAIPGLLDHSRIFRGKGGRWAEKQEPFWSHLGVECFQDLALEGASQSQLGHLLLMGKSASHTWHAFSSVEQRKAIPRSIWPFQLRAALAAVYLNIWQAAGYKCCPWSQSCFILCWKVATQQRWGTAVEWLGLK